MGKAEMAYIRESLAAGRALRDVLMDLASPVIVDVFGDYTDNRIAETWRAAKRAAGDLGQHRVVLRTPGHSDDAVRAASLAECARLQGRFGAVQETLIRHTGPWDETRLLHLAARSGLDRDDTAACLEGLDLADQLRKDRAHALERGIRRTPVVTVNRRIVEGEEGALRGAIAGALRESAI